MIPDLQEIQQALNLTEMRGEAEGEEDNDHNMWVNDNV